MRAVPMANENLLAVTRVRVCGLLLCRYVLDLFDYILVLVLRPEVYVESDDGADDATDASAPEYGIVQQVVVEFVDFVA